MLRVWGLVCRVLRLRFVVPAGTILLLALWSGAAGAQVTPALTWSSQSPATSPSVRFGAAMAYDPSSGQVVLFGGQGSKNNTLNDTWTWNGTTWTQLSPATSPPSRLNAAMAYDANSGQLVLFGGLNNNGNGTSLLGDTWTWNGTTWTQQTPATSPQARFYATMAYDPSSGQVVLFGGETVNSDFYVGDTWTWNGSTWTPQNPATSPPSRGTAAMAYDATFGQLLLFGGDGNGTGFPFLNDTWTWNGTTWTQLSPAASPPPTGQAVMAYDANSGQLVLFGGANDEGLNILGDTWTWNGTTWTQQTTVASPEARFSAAMAYDPSSGQVVLFGGESNTDLLGDTWALQQGPVNLGSANLCPAGATMPAPCGQTATLAFDVAAGTTISSINVLTQGAPNLDFKAATTQESNACATQTYQSVTTCTVTVSFAPEHPGQRLGAVVIQDSTDDPPATTYVFGMGQGPQIAFSPPTQSTIPVTGLLHPQGLAVDSSGNIYITDTNNNRVLKETLSGGSYTQSTIPATGLAGPEGVAVDGSGNVYIANTEGGSGGTGNVLLETLAGGSYTQSTIPATGLADPIGVAVDGTGNVYIANFNGGSGGTGNVLKETLSGGSYTQSTIPATGLAGPIGVAVDSSGNVYIANIEGGSSGPGNVLLETLAGGSYTQSTIPATGLMGPEGVTVDSNGNVYIANTSGGSGTGNVLKETLAGGSYTQSTIPATGLGFPAGVAVDGSGNVYIANFGDGSSEPGNVLMEDYADAPTLRFTTATNDGTTDTADGALSVTITNGGNEPLTAVSPGLSVAPDFAQTGGSCTTGFSLAANVSCSLSVEFEPVTPASGPVDGSVMLTDNNLNATPSTAQTISLVGTAVLGNAATHYSISAPATVVSSSPVFQTTITALDASNHTATGYNGTAVLSSSDPGADFFPRAVTFIDGIAQPAIGLRTAGIQTVTATDTTTSSITGSTSILVTPGPTTRFAVSAPATATSGTAFNFTVTAADLSGNTTPAYSGTIQFSSTDGLAMLPANSTLTNGAATFSATLNTVGNRTITATDTVTNSIAGTSGTIAVSKPSTTTNLALSAGTVTSGTPVTLTATVTAGGNPVINGIVSFYEQIGSELVPLGDAQIVAANSNSAVLKYIFGPGTTAVVAKFHTTASLQRSVSVAQTVKVTGLDATATTIASSGTVGNYTLTGTVASFGVSAPQGSVSFEDQSSGNTVLSAIPLDSATLTNSFAAAQNYATGTNPYGVATADLNGDGIPDLAVANNSSGNVSVLLGHGDGTFATAVSYLVGAAPSAIVIGDFNRDGIPDLAVTNYGSNTLSILLGNGNGTFQAQQTFAVGSLPSSIAIGDFNKDGIPDLAVTNYSGGAGTVSILLGNGNGTFQTQQTFAVGNSPFGIAVADLANNGKQDLIVANTGSDNISILLGNGDGTFQPQVTYPVSVANNSAWAVTVGDFNGDGFPDVAAATGANVSVWLGTGNGTLNAAVGYNAGNTAYAILTHDLYGNGKLDLVVANTNGGNVSILAGNGDGTFGSPVNYSTSGVPQAVVVGDFNSDGRPDLAVVTGVGNNTNILLGEQTESATATGISVAGSSTQNVFASYPGDTDYASSISGTIPLNGSQATQTISFPAPTSPLTYGVSTITLTATTSSGLPVSYTVTGPATVSGSALTVTGAGSVVVTATQTGDTSYLAATPVSRSITVNKAVPVLTWPTPAPIGYGTALSNAQLDASATGLSGASLGGSFTYNPLAGTVPAAGPQSLQVSFAPTDTTDYTTATSSVTLTVNGATLQVTANNAAKVYGTANPTFTGTVSGELPGKSFTESFTSTATTGSPAGSYPIVPSVTGATVADYTLTITNGTLAVTKAGSTTTVSASPTAASLVQTVTLTAAVISQTSGTPTGTVTFYDNGTALMSEPLTAGMAQLTTLLPASATAVITATYQGDNNFLGSTSSNSASVVVAPFDFTFTNTGTSAYTAAPGAVASYNFALAPLYGSYAGTVSFSVTGLPTGSTANFTPSAVAVNGGATPVVLTVLTASATAHNNSNNPFGRGIVLALLFSPFAAKRRVREKLKGRMLLLLLLLVPLMAGLTATLTGCGSQNGFLLHSPQTYTLTVTATSGTFQHSQTVTLIVQ